MPRERRRTKPTPTSCLVPTTLLPGTNCLILTNVGFYTWFSASLLDPHGLSYDRVILGSPRRLGHVEVVRHVRLARIIHGRF